MITTIIFDWGGVLAPADNASTARKLSRKYNLDFSHLKRRLGELEAQNSISSDYSGFTKGMEQEFNIPGKEAIKCLLDYPAGPGFEFARSIKGRFKLCILSNQMHFKTQDIRNSNDLSFFDCILFSSEVGLQKPSKEMFHLLLEQINEKPESCLFIDDNIDNINSAISLGFRGLHSQDIEKLNMGVDNAVNNAEDFLNKDAINDK